MRLSRTIALFVFAFICLFGSLPAHAAATAAAPQKSLSAPDPEVAVMETTLGNIVLGFYPNAAPGHVKNFKTLARKGFYNGTTFHRVIPNFMIQGGDPNSKDNDRSNDGMGDAGYTIKAEFNDISHKRGILSMARSSDPNSASSQFFITVADIPRLDHQYTVFGYVVSGMDVVDKIVNVPRDDKDNPLKKVVIRKVTIEKSTSTQPAATK